MFLNTFHREHILLKSKIKNILRKIKFKNLTAGFIFFLISNKSSVTSSYIFLKDISCYILTFVVVKYVCIMHGLLVTFDGPEVKTGQYNPMIAKMA